MPPPNPSFDIPKPDFHSNQSLPSSESFNFSVGSIDAAEFKYSNTGPEKANFSSRSRPRLMKTRRKQMVAPQDGQSVKTDLGLNGFSGFSGEIKFDAKLGNAFGDSNGSSGSNGSAGSGYSSGHMGQLGNGLGLARNLNDSLSGLCSGSEKSLFGSSINNTTSNLRREDADLLFSSNKGSSNVDTQKETGSFVFGARMAGSMTNVNFPDGSSVLGSSKIGLAMDQNRDSGQFASSVGETDSAPNSNFNAEESNGHMGQPKVHEFHKSDSTEFVFGSHKYDSASRKLDKKVSNKSSLQFGVDGFGKFNSANFVFGATKDASSVLNSDLQKQECRENMDQSESDKDAGKAVPDMRGKDKFGSSGDSEKVCHPCSQFPSNWSDNSSKNHANFLFGSNNSDSKLSIGLEKKPTTINMGMPKFTDKNKENAEIDSQSRNACPNSFFVFGGLKGKWDYNSDGSSKLFNGMDQLNRGKAEDCNGSRQHSHDTRSNIDSNEHNSSLDGIFDKCPAFNNCDSEVGSKKTEKFTSNFSMNKDNVFVFGNDQKNTGVAKENHPINMSETIPDASHVLHNNSESNRTSFLFPSISKDEKDSINLASKVAGLDLSDADYSTPNMKFVFSNNNLFSGIDKKLDNANSKSLAGRRSKKRTGKLRKKAVVHQLFGQDHVSKEGNSQLNEKSPGCGSPMDFSPYQDTSASNISEAEIGTAVKVEFAANNNDIPDVLEKSHDDESKSSFSPSLPAKDGLSAVRRRYKMKYKSKGGSNHTAQGNNSDKENAERESVGTATHEVCEHWRIRYAFLTVEICRSNTKPPRSALAK